MTYTVGKIASKTSFNSLATATAALTSAAGKEPDKGGIYSLSFDQDCPKQLIGQVVDWLAVNPTKWPANQINFISLTFDTPVEHYTRYDARVWVAKLAKARPDWKVRENYVGANKILTTNGLSKPK